MVVLLLVIKALQCPLFKNKKHVRSVADPGCLSLILIFIHPGFRIQQQHQKRTGKTIFLPFTLFVATNIIKL